MVVQGIENLMATLFIIASLHRCFFRWYTSIVYSILKLAAVLLVSLVLLIPKFAIGIIKSVFTTALIVVLLLVYTLTSFIPYLGQGIESVQSIVRNRLLVSDFSAKLHRMRGVMIRVVAEESDRDLEFEHARKYRSELIEIRENGKRRLESGETFLSVFLGFVLLFSQLVGIELLQSSIYIIPVSVIVEIWLLAITVSIIYRTSVLEFLCYDSDSEFESLDQMDAALSYQKGISSAEIIQGLTFIVVFISAISRVKLDLVEEVLRKKYTGEDWVAFAWDHLTN